MWPYQRVDAKRQTQHDKHNPINPKMRAIDSACRLQFTALAQFAVRSMKDWEVIKEEFTAAVRPEVLQQMYDIAVSDKFGFLFMDMKRCELRP